METAAVLRSEFDSVPICAEPLHRILFDAIQRHSRERRVAFISAENGEKIEYKKVKEAILHIVAYLESHGFGHGDIASAVLRNCWQFAAIFIGTIARGGALSAASPLFTDFELGRQFRDSQSKIVFCMEYSLEMVIRAAQNCPDLRQIVVIDGPEKSLPHGVIHLNEILRRPVPLPKFFEDTNVERDMVALPYSSGTTGSPKGVMLSHRSFGTLLRILDKHMNEQIIYKIDPEWRFDSDHILHVLPFYHIYGFGMLMHSVLNGAQSVIMQKYEPELFLRSVQNYNIKFGCLVPPILVFLSRSPLVNNYDLRSLKFIMSGAAPVGKEVIDAVHQQIPSLQQISQAYGMTEESMASHLPVFGLRNHSAAGRLMSNYEQKIVDLENGKALNQGKIGEICVRSPTLMMGYFNRPDATRECIDDEGFLHTGDIGYVDENGWTYVVDRRKELIKVKGLQVAPAELEDILLSNPQIADCAVTSVKDERAGELPKAFVVRSDPQLTVEEVQRYVAERVAAYKRLVGGVEFVAEIPKSPSGKILRRLLRSSKL